jgi:MoaA/NifB/PqqE/SkfB family radical SAM enzyme
MNRLNEYICAVPFDSLEVHDKRNFLCCASWLTKHLPEGASVYDSFNSQEAKDVRDSMIDGSYRYCDENQCPYLKMFKNGTAAPIYHKDKLSEDLKERVERHKKGLEIKPTVVQFSMDRTCNLKCPSCRLDLIVADSHKIKQVKAHIQEIEDTYADSIKTLYITGTGDPFVSVGFRDFLRNFDKSKYPNLDTIHLHTNATKWNKEMWESMPNVHEFVHSAEISIDAATKYTYENETRIGGDWDELIENLHFISKLPNLKRVKTSFVVQDTNYKEMKLFYDTMTSIFEKKTKVFFGRINNWDTFTEDEFEQKKVWDSNHPYYNDFVKEVNSVLPAYNCFHNLEEFLYKKSNLI